MKHWFIGAQITLIWLCFHLSGCGSRLASNAAFEAYPKASDDATIVYQLQSNKHRTHFYIDSKEMGVGRKLKVRINNQGHTVVAHPEGCTYKEEFIQPPYNSKVPLSFTFLLGECREQSRPVADNSPPNITITSHEARGVEVGEETDSKITIEGNVTDESGVASVAIDGKLVTLDKNGSFSARVLLRGEELNIIAISAADIYGNEAVERLTIDRKRGNGAPAIRTDRRFALVIGNRAYRELGRLKNPVNDAKDMASVLKATGFTVKLLLNANQEQMEQAINVLGRKLTSGGVGLVYYAGHGIQIDGANYLVPIGAGIRRQKDVRYKAVNLGQILDEMGYARNGFNIVILDACRNNTLPRSFRSTSRGLAEVVSPRGTLIGFATSPGSVALDGEGRNGVYTKHLLASIRTPGLTVEQVFKRVSQGVVAETGGNQVPWISSSFYGDFTFVKE